MESVIIAIGANLGDRLGSLKKAAAFLEDLSITPPVKASIWESEPVGPAKYPFYNTTVKITTDLTPKKLLEKLKQVEKQVGRIQTERWGPRILDLDIIRFGNLVIDSDNLIIPHPEYKNRLFVLLPMLEIDPEWCDPANGKALKTLAEEAPEIEIQQTDISW